MSDIINDIVENVNIKPSKTKVVIKWVVSVSLTLITAAFVFGQFKASFFNRLDGIENTIKEQTKATDELKLEMNAGFDQLNTRVDKVYDDGYKAFDDFQQYNKKMLILVIDNVNSNKNLLKQMLEVTTIEKTKNVENQLEQAKSEKPTYESNIIVRPISAPSKPYVNLSYGVNNQTGDTTFRLIGATKEYINTIDRNRYILGQITPNEDNPKLFDVNYINK